MDAKFAGYCLCAGEGGIDDPGKFDILRRVGLKVAIDARVIAAEGSGADDSDAQHLAAIWHSAIVAQSVAGGKKQVNRGLTQMNADQEKVLVDCANQCFKIQRGIREIRGIRGSIPANPWAETRAR